MMTLPKIDRRTWLALWAQGRRRNRLRFGHPALLPAPVLRAAYPDLLRWDWVLLDPFKWNVWMSLDGGGSWTLIEDYWTYGDARQFSPDGGHLLYFIVGVDEAGNEITRRSNIVRPDDAPVPSPLLTGLAAYWDGDSPWDALGNVELKQAGGGMFGSDQSLPGWTEGPVLEAFSESDLFYSKDPVFDHYSARTVNCWFYLNNWQGMFLLSDMSDDGVGYCTALGIRFCPNSYFYQFYNAYADGWDSPILSLSEDYFNYWFMVTLTSDDNEVRVYINGVLSGTLAKTGPTVTYTGEGPESFYVNGPHPWGNMIGWACYLGVWDRVLDPSELETLYNNGTGRAFAGL